MRNSEAYQTKKAHHREENRNATQQADDGCGLLGLRNIFAEACRQRRDGWIQLRVDAPRNCFDGRRERAWITGRTHQHSHTRKIIGARRIIDLRRVCVVHFHGPRVAHHADHNVFAVLPLLSDRVIVRPALAR